MARRPVPPPKWETAALPVVNDFKKASTPSKVMVLGLLILFIVVAIKQFDGYEYYLNEDVTGAFYLDRYTHIRLYSWWGLREKHYDVEWRLVLGEDYHMWHVKESDQEEGEWRPLFLLMGEYDEVGLNIRF